MLEWDLAAGVELGAAPEKRLRLERRLGAGGFGEVWVGTLAATGEKVAVKVLKASALDMLPAELGENVKERFLREAASGMGLEHPNLVRTRFLDRHEGLDYIAMELCEQGTLEDYIEQRNPPLEERLRILVGAARGLSALHERYMTHRDVKPANILLKDGVPKVSDFGLAKWKGKLGQAGFTITAAGQVLGSAEYMAPEQLEEARNVDPRADVYSLGILLHWLATGRGIRLEDIEAGKDDKLAARLEFPGMLAWFRAMTARDRERRPPHAGEVAEKVERYIANAATARAWLKSRRLRPDEVWEPFHTARCASCGKGPIAATDDDDPDLRFRHCVACGKEQ